MTEDKSTRYHRLRRRTEIAAVVWPALLLAGLLVFGGAAAVGALAERLTDGSPALSLALVVTGLVVLHAPGSFLLGWYGHLLERRYGLSRQTTRHWAVDHVKTSVLGLTLALIGAQIVYATLAVWPGWWWLASAGIFTLLLIVLVNLGPALLLPLFFRVTPLRHEALRNRLSALARRAGAPVVGVFEWTLGDRTRKANAALTGLGATRRILISDTMLEHYSDDEIEVVLAHELGHQVHHDIWRSIALEGGVILAGFYAASRALAALSPLLGLRGPADPASTPLLALTLGAVALALAPAVLAASRGHERRADRFALDLTRNPAAFLSAMRRLGGQNLAEERPSRLVEWLFYSHPPMADRLAAASRWAPPSPGVSAAEATSRPA